MLPYLAGGSTSPVDGPALNEDTQVSVAVVGAEPAEIGSGHHEIMTQHPDTSRPFETVQEFPGPVRFHQWLGHDKFEWQCHHAGGDEIQAIPAKMFRVAGPHEPPIVFFKDNGAPRAVEEALLDHRRPRPLAPEHEQGPSLISRCGHHAPNCVLHRRPCPPQQKWFVIAVAPMATAPDGRIHLFSAGS